MKPPMNADSRGWIRRKSASIGVDRRFLPARRYEGSLATYSEEAQPFAAHGPFGVEALACPGQCSLKAELRTFASHGLAGIVGFRGSADCDMKLTWWNQRVSI